MIGLGFHHSSKAVLSTRMESNYRYQHAVLGGSLDSASCCAEGHCLDYIHSNLRAQMFSCWNSSLHRHDFGLMLEEGFRVAAQETFERRTSSGSDPSERNSSSSCCTGLGLNEKKFLCQGEIVNDSSSEYRIDN